MIKGILLDSGRVLNEAQSGHWFISPDFFKFVDEEKFHRYKKHEIRASFLKGLVYLDKQKIILTEEEEHKHFTIFYQLFLNALPDLKEGDNQAEKLAEALVYDSNKYVFYPEVSSFLEEVSENYALGVISDAWPSLIKVFESAGYRHYFDTMVISSLIGTNKPHAMMYNQALNDLNLSPEEVIFVDDRPNNCLGAQKIGIKSYLLCRHWSNYLVYKFKYPQLTIVRNLTELKRKYLS